MAAFSRSVQRLRRRRDFVAVLRGGRRSRHRLVTLVVRGNGLPHNRYGFAVGRNVGTAVARNRTKRRLRDIVHRLSLQPGHDVIVIAAPESVSASSDELAGAIEQCARRSSLIGQ